MREIRPIPRNRAIALSILTPMSIAYERVDDHGRITRGDSDGCECGAQRSETLLTHCTVWRRVGTATAIAIPTACW